MAAQADAGVWQKVAPAAVEGLATAAQAADAVAWQKAASVAVEGREHAISVVSLVQRTVCTSVWFCVFALSLENRACSVWRVCVCIPTPTAE
jgi:hypothetical protein